MKKPEVTLTQLEEEPATGLFGCTFTEIQAAFQKACLIAVISTVIASFFIRWEHSAIIGLLFGGLSGWLIIKATARRRSDKPLYYQKHIKTYRKAKYFVQPATFYQRERNSNVTTKK